MMALFDAPGSALGNFADTATRDLAMGGAIDPAFGSTRPRSYLSTPEEFVDMVGTWFKDRREQRGGSAADLPGSPVEATYAARRFAKIEAFEGSRPNVYKDTAGLRTVGVGFNMDQPGAPTIWAQAGLPAEKFEQVRSGAASLTPTEIRTLADTSINSAEVFVARKFQGVDLPESRRLALVSLAFNNPSLIGPKLTAAVREGRWGDAVSEVLFDSGTQKEPRLAARRYREAEMLAGADAPLPQFAEYRSQLSRA